MADSIGMLGLVGKISDPGDQLAHWCGFSNSVCC